MWHARCPYCRSAAPGRSATTPSGRSVAECSACGRIIAERQLHTHHLFLRRATDEPLPLVASDLPHVPTEPLRFPGAPTDDKDDDDDEDPFHPTGFIAAFSTWSLEHTPLLVRASSSFAGHLAELERALLDCSSSSSSSDKENKNKERDGGGGSPVSVDHLRAYLQILEVSSILGLDHDIVDHAFQLFKDCSTTICLRNRSIEALATAALVHAIREAQEPRTLQEISAASNLQQKEIGKYIKILGEALQLSQPINSNSISVHMPRFCNLLQLNKSAQELAAHIGEVVVNKCFCTRRNPISISAAAIYLACQLEDKRKTQAEICKVTGLTEVTLRKVYKELLENWDDLLPPNYTPAVPPEKAFPMNTGTSRSWTPKVDTADLHHLRTNQDSQAGTQPDKQTDPMEINHIAIATHVEKEGSHGHSHTTSTDTRDLNLSTFRQSEGPFQPDGAPSLDLNDMKSSLPELEQKLDMNLTNLNRAPWMGQTSSPSSSKIFINLWPSAASQAPSQSYTQVGKQQLDLNFATPFQSSGNAQGEDDSGFLQ